MVVWQTAAFAVSGAAALGFGVSLANRLLRYRDAPPGQETLGEASTEAPESAEAGLAQTGLAETGLGDTWMDRYRPMSRLLDAGDLRFLASQPGFRPEMETRLRDSRRRIFRMYLRELFADFQRLHAAARRMVAEAPEQRADLIPMLMRQQIAFWRSLAAIELRLTLAWAGFAPANANRLLEIVDQLQRALAATAPVPASAMG